MDKKQYKFRQIPLIPTIAKELIFFLFEGKGPQAKAAIGNKVNKYHIDNGGLPGKSKLTNTIQGSLAKLKKERRARNPVTGYWEILEYKREIGDGNNWVYLYYFPNTREMAIQNGMLYWDCKIGFTNVDAYERIKELTKGSSEQPRIPLLIKTNKAEIVEKSIHKILTDMGKHNNLARGKEWFITNPMEIEEIYLHEVLGNVD